MLIRPIITEKTVAETGIGRFAFEVTRDTNKTQVKQLVEKMFAVKVIKVQTLNMAGSRYRMGRRFRFGTKPDWKKAIVTLAKGQKIALFDIPSSANEGATEEKK